MSVTTLKGIEIYKGQVGLAIQPHCVDENGDDIPVTDATTKNVLLESPSGVDKSFAGTFSGTPLGDGSDGRFRYVTAATSDLDEDGWWFAQGEVVTPTKAFKTKRCKFPVGLALDEN
jgi:hypothetical protein